MTAIIKFFTLLLLCSFSYPAYAQLHLDSPNGGETFKVGGKMTIRWSGIASTDVVTLEFSTDNGVNWNTITTTATGLQYTWLNIPNAISNTCLLRVSHSTTVVPGEVDLFGSSDYECATFSKDGKYVLCPGSDGNCYIWDSHSAQLLHTFKTETGAGVKPFYALNHWADFSPDGKTFAVSSITSDTDIYGQPYGNWIRICDANTGTKIREWKQTSEPKQSFADAEVLFSPDGKRLAASGKDSIYVYDIATGDTTAKLGGFTKTGPTFDIRNPPISFDWNFDGSEIIAAARDTSSFFPSYVRSNTFTSDTIQTYWIKTNKPLSVFVRPVHFSPDGKRFIACTEDTTARVWDVQTCKVLFSLRAGLIEVDNAIFSHDGKTIATIGYDSLGVNSYSVKLWDAQTGAYIRTVGTPNFSTGDIEFNNDDSRILVSSFGMAIIYQNPSGGSQSDISDGPWSIVANNGGNIIVYTPDVSAKVNDIVSIPVLIDDPGSAIAGGATTVTITLDYNVTMLEPIQNTPAGTISGNIRSIPLTLTINPNDTVLTRLAFKVALGNDSVTKLDVINPLTNSPTVLASDQDGQFTLLDLCRQGGARLLNPDGVVSMIVLSPNPTSTLLNIKLDLAEYGHTSVSVADETGRVVKTLLDEDTRTPSLFLKVPVSDLPSGRYYVLLQTPTYRSRQAIEVKR